MAVYRKVLLEAAVLEIAFKAFIFFKFSMITPFSPSLQLLPCTPTTTYSLTNLLPLSLCEIYICVCTYNVYMYVYVCVYKCINI